MSDSYQTITNQRELERYCQASAGAATIALDTEFVSEDRYRPELCLLQVAVDDKSAIIDPLAVKDLSPFWELLTTGRHQTLVHAGRQEVCFCLEAVGKRPVNLFDCQIAAGLIGLEYPAAYHTLVQKLLGTRLGKGETRTDWRRRPLSARQLEYAVRDVAYLAPLHQALSQRLARLNRESWLKGEMEDWQTRVEEAEYSDRWRRVGGMSGLSPRELALVRELWLWREAAARRQNCPPRRILRDDLIVELARRGQADLHAVGVVRGLNRRDKQALLPALVEALQRGLALPEDQLPHAGRRHSSRPQLTLVGQFLAAAISSICQSQHLAPSLVGTVEDIRDLIAYRLDLNRSGPVEPPILARGWRCQILGSTVDDLLSGRLALRIRDPLAAQPLSLDPVRE